MGKLVLYLEDLLRQFAIARVANPKNGLNLEPKPAVVPERQAVKKPLFFLKIRKFYNPAIQIKPSKKALF
jgi:hypothetical protein